jgi:hypothetical protein
LDSRRIRFTLNDPRAANPCFAKDVYTLISHLEIYVIHLIITALKTVMKSLKKFYVLKRLGCGGRIIARTRDRSWE